MGRIRFLLAVWAARCIALACRLVGTRGSTAPGKAALRLCPDFIRQASRKVRRQIIVVCGTNGKTTTNNLINAALLSAGYCTVCNRAGANMLNGIAAAFAQRVGFLGGMGADFACLEADEANLPLLFAELTPDIVVVTNLFRDQLDRYGEIDITAQLLKKAFAMAPEALLVLNADDPVTSVFGSAGSCYCGIIGQTDMRCLEEIRDGNNCQRCGSPLTYSYYHYGQLGRYHCSKCGYENPPLRFGADAIRINRGVLNFDITWNDQKRHIVTGVSGLYNVYNMLMAFGVCQTLGIPADKIALVLSAQQPEPGRMSRFEIGGSTVYLILSKNPTGFNQSVMTVVNDHRLKDVLIVLNDNAQDGEDISWIWDVDFEAMSLSETGAYVVSGTRRWDMYLRLKYAGYDTAALTVCDTIREAIMHMLSGRQKVYYVLVNYTAMYPAYTVLSKLAGKGEDNG